MSASSAAVAPTPGVPIRVARYCAGEPEAFFDLEEETIAFGVLRGRGDLSGADVAMPAYALAGYLRSLLNLQRGRTRTSGEATGAERGGNAL